MPERDENSPHTIGAPPDIVISAATSADVDGLLALTRDCIERMRADGIDQWDERYPDRGTIEADIRSGAAFTASQDGGLVASVVLNEHQDPEYDAIDWRFTDGPATVVHRLMVHPRLEGRGLARVLMKFAEDRAGRVGHRAIRLDAFANNPRALRLYEKLGYRDAGTVVFRKGVFRCFEKEIVPRRRRRRLSGE